MMCTSCKRISKESPEKLDFFGFDVYNTSVCWRANHSLEMMSWIRLQAEIPVPYPALLFWRGIMDFLNGKIKPLYFRCLAATFGSAFIASIYGIVDMAMVGQYQGPDGTAALAVVAPIWNIIYSLGLWMGIGGSVLFSTIRGEGGEDAERQSNQYFTAALIGCVLLSAVSWPVLIFFQDEMLMLFGADEALLSLAKRYLVPIMFVIPSYLFAQFFSSFLRNDGNPGLATKAVLFGGLFNIFGDYFLVFYLDMGIMGAGLATAAGSVLSLLVMLTHFIGKKNTITFAFPRQLPVMLKKIVSVGFSAFFIDIAMGILTMLFNRQIMVYLGTAALSVYGIIINISTFVQCCGYSVGQAAQPMMSVNFGAGKQSRIQEVLKYAIGSALGFGVFWIVVSTAIPIVLVYIFMTPTEAILSIAPGIIRAYGISFFLLPFNIFSTYYFQSLLKNAQSFVVSVSRGLVISGILIFVLPVLAGGNAIWYAMPLTELIVTIYVIRNIARH